MPRGAVERHGGVGVWVNNAAVTIAVRSSRSIRPSGNEVLTTCAGPTSGAVSPGCTCASVNGVHYAASKAGIVAITRFAASELAPFGVTVNAVAPAAIDGPSVAAVPAEKIEAMVQTIPVGRLGLPNEVAGLVACLSGDEAGFVTGATYDINGGMLMR